MQIEITPDYLASQGLSSNFPERFFSKIEKMRGCWDWTGYRDKNGYGTIRRGGKGEKIQSHRASWILHCGPIPEGLCVLHSCDNPPCCNVLHLFLGTEKDNTIDALKKGRLARGENHPSSKLTESQVKEIINCLKHVKYGDIRNIGRKFEVSEGTIWAIQIGNSWRHISRTGHT